MDLLNRQGLSKGTAFTEDERSKLGLHGLPRSARSWAPSKSRERVCRSSRSSCLGRAQPALALPMACAREEMELDMQRLKGVNPMSNRWRVVIAGGGFG